MGFKFCGIGNPQVKPRNIKALHLIRGEQIMRKIILLLVLSFTLLGSTGCIIPAYSGDPKQRTGELINTSENLRLVRDEWQRFWLLDQPRHATPIRTHGGIL